MRRWSVALVVIATMMAGCSSADDEGDVESTGAVPQVSTTEDVIVTPDPAPKEVRTVATSQVGEAVQPDGVPLVRARITSADDEVCEVCVWLADDSAERSQGLKGVTDLGEAVGMVFSWDEPVANRFVMIETPTPLSIAWFDDTGAYVSEVDMEPCLDVDAVNCARYSAAAPYVLAIEMFQGELDAIGIGPGSRLELLTGTEAPTCDASG